MNLRRQLALALGAAALWLSASVSFAQLPAPLLTAQREIAPSGSSPGSDFGRVIRIERATVVSAHKIDVAAQSDGLVSQLLADEGQRVQKGDTLLVIDNRVAIAELGVARKEFEAAGKQAEQTAEVDHAKKASEVADAEYKDIYELYQKGSATYFEARRKQLEKERASLAIDVAQVKHEQEILAADVAEERMSAAQVKLDLYKVIAPYDGVIVKRMRDQGEWIRAGEPVLKLVHMNEMKVEMFVDVSDISIADLHGAPMKIAVRVNPRDTATFTDARVDFVSPEIEGGQVRIATRIQNQLIGDTWLLSDGMPATIEITLPQ